jgi:hypothetical protein
MNRETFDAAYKDWRTSQRPQIDDISSLWDIYQSVEHYDEVIGDVLTSYERGEPSATLQIEQWPDASRDIQSLRRRLQTERHQVATRALLDHTPALKRAFDAYRALKAG